MTQISKPKVFGIGLNKTGTTTLGTCLECLGYQHQSVRPDLQRAWLRGDRETVFKVTDAFQSFEDWPWPLMYRELYERYPDAKFILTLRSTPEKWLNSLKAHAMFTKPLWSCRKGAYGYHYPHNSEQAHLDYYDRHTKEVVAFFEEQGASDQLKLLCWENGDGWPELGKFLDVTPPQGDLPHANATNTRSASGYELVNKLLVRLKGVAS